MHQVLNKQCLVLLGGSKATATTVAPELMKPHITTHAIAVCIYCVHKTKVWKKIHRFKFSSLQVIQLCHALQFLLETPRFNFILLHNSYRIRCVFIWLFFNGLNSTKVSNIRMYCAVVNNIHTDLGYYVTIQVTLYFIGFIQRKKLLDIIKDIHYRHTHIHINAEQNSIQWNLFLQP